MKIKKKTLTVLLLSLLVSLCLLCFGVTGIATAYAEETPNTESTVTQEDTTEDSTATDWNKKIKAWIDTILGGAGITLDALLIAILSKKNKQSVSVTVNDAETQKKLDSLNAEYTNLKQLIVDIFQLNKGTLEVLLTLYSNNTNLDENVRGVIKAISLNSEDVVKDVMDILDADKHKEAKTTLQHISNIVLG